jgi:hypothetical protein
MVITSFIAVAQTCLMTILSMRAILASSASSATDVVISVSPDATPAVAFSLVAKVIVTMVVVLAVVVIVLATVIVISVSIVSRLVVALSIVVGSFALNRLISADKECDQCDYSDEYNDCFHFVFVE